MDRYAVIVVDRQTGKPELYAIYDGEHGADAAERQAESKRNASHRAFVVGLAPGGSPR